MVWRVAALVLAVVCVQTVSAQYYTVDVDTLRLYTWPRAGADVGASVPRGTCLEYKDTTTADGWRMMQKPGEGLIWGWTREKLPEASEEQVAAALEDAAAKEDMLFLSIGALTGGSLIFTLIMLVFCVLFLFRFEKLAAWFNRRAEHPIVPEGRLSLLLLYPLVVIIPMRLGAMVFPLNVWAWLGVGAAAALVAILIRSGRIGFRAAFWEFVYAVLSLVAVGYLLTLLVWVLVIYVIVWFVRSDRSSEGSGGSGGGSGGGGSDDSDDGGSGNSVDYRHVCGNCIYFRDPMCPYEGNSFIGSNDDACGSFHQR